MYYIWPLNWITLGQLWTSITDRNNLVVTDNATQKPQDELKTSAEETSNVNVEKNENDKKSTNISRLRRRAVGIILHYCVLAVLGSLTWGLLWLAFGEEWSIRGRWFRLAAVAVTAWSTGQVLEITTSLPPLLGALLTGILARNLDLLDMRQYTEIDSFLRKIYPVIILGKGSLAWDVNYIKQNWKLVYSLGVLPWLTEVVTIATSTHLVFDFPWMWGFLFASFYASVSCPILMPLVKSVSAGKNLSQNWPQLICTASGTDTTLSVVLFGMMHSFLMYNGNDKYNYYIQVVFGVLLGLVVGVGWGMLANFLPHSSDVYMNELRVLFVVIGGLFLSFLTSHYGLGGSAGLAVLACNSTAANQWAKKDWSLKSNPATTSYQVMWSTLEPILFAYTGTFVSIKAAEFSLAIVPGFGVLFACLSIRLIVAFLVCTNLSVKERLYVCCTWMPKSIVEAVLCPIAINTLLSHDKYYGAEKEYANTIIMLTVQAILVTTPIGYLFTKYLGPVLLKERNKKEQDESTV